MINYILEQQIHFKINPFKAIACDYTLNLTSCSSTPTSDHLPPPPPLLSFINRRIPPSFINLIINEFHNVKEDFLVLQIIYTSASTSPKSKTLENTTFLDTRLLFFHRYALQSFKSF